MIKAVIFDFDGVIVDSERLHFMTEKNLLRKYGAHLSEQTFEQTLGRSVRDTLSLYKGIYNISSSLEELLQQHDKLFLQLVDQYLQINDGFIELLDLLQKHKYPFAIASSGTLEYITHALNKFNLIHLFINKITTIDMVKRGKPAPDLFLDAARELEINPSFCLVIEDSVSGIKAAKSAGMQSLFLNTEKVIKEQDYNTRQINSLKNITLELLAEI